MMRVANWLSNLVAMACACFLAWVINPPKLKIYDGEEPDSLSEQ